MAPSRTRFRQGRNAFSRCVALVLALGAGQERRSGDRRVYGRPVKAGGRGICQPPSSSMRTRSSASCAVPAQDSSSVRTHARPAIQGAALLLCRGLCEATWTADRAVRNHGTSPAVVSAITAIPRTAMRNDVAGGDAVRATVKNTIAHSGSVSLRRNTNAISCLLLLLSSAGARLERLH